MGFAAAHNGLIDGLVEIPEHGLFFGVVGDLLHDEVTFPHLVSDGVGVIHEASFGKPLGDEEFVASGSGRRGQGTSSVLPFLTNTDGHRCASLSQMATDE